jgi:Cu2+-exporting ATPase
MNRPISVPAAEAALVTSRFAVPGMRCAGCIAKLEAGLPAAVGVAAARVNFTTKQVVVSHDPAMAMPALVQAFAGLGFDANPIHDALGAPDNEARALVKAGRKDEARQQLEEALRHGSGETLSREVAEVRATL